MASPKKVDAVATARRVIAHTRSLSDLVARVLPLPDEARAKLRELADEAERVVDEAELRARGELDGDEGQGARVVQAGKGERDP